MSAKERASLINKLYKVCKKEFQAITPPAGRTVLEHVVYACCLEDSSFEAADESFAKLQSEYIDWNEVRVTTRAELAEICKSTSFPKEAASRVKKTLHGVFEGYYSFEIDHVRKENIGKALTQFGKYKGTTPFVISYMAQNGLNGHSIPIDRSFMNLMYYIGAVKEKEIETRKVSGLERTIPKNKGVEFFSVVHQLAVAFTKSPFNKGVRELVLKIAPDAKERFPKRGGKKKAEPVKETKKPVKEEKTKAAAKTSKSAKASKKAAKPAKKKAAKPAGKKKAAGKKVAKKKVAKKKVAKKKVAKKKSIKKRPTKKTTSKKKSNTVRKKSTKKKKSPTRRLARKKPR